MTETLPGTGPGCIYVAEQLGYGFALCSVVVRLELGGRGVSAINTKSHTTAVIRMCYKLKNKDVPDRSKRLDLSLFLFWHQNSVFYSENQADFPASGRSRSLVYLLTTNLNL